MALSEASRVIAANNRNVAMATKHLEFAKKHHETSIAIKERSKAAFEADCRVEEVARQGVDAAKALLEDAKKHQQEDDEYYKAIVIDGDEPQPKKPRVSNDVIAKQVAVKDAASKEVDTVKYPDQVVVEGAGSPEVNGVYKRSGMWNGAPKYVIDGKLGGHDRKFELHRGDSCWYIVTTAGGKKSGANFMFPLLYSPLKLFLRPCLQTGLHFYLAIAKVDNILPPKSGWRTFLNEKESAPQIKY
jgi:hypothetical protein